HVVAGGDAEPGAFQVEGDQLVAGGDGAGLVRAEGVEQVDLAVLQVRVPVRAAHHRRVVDAAVLGGGEGAGDHHHAVLLGELLDQLGEVLVVGEGGRAQVRAEGGEGRLGQKHQVRALGRGL